MNFYWYFSFPLACLICCTVGGAVIPLPVPSDPSSSFSWTEFDDRILLEPFFEMKTEGTGVPRKEAGPFHQQSIFSLIGVLHQNSTKTRIKANYMSDTNAISIKDTPIIHELRQKQSSIRDLVLCNNLLFIEKNAINRIKE